MDQPVTRTHLNGAVETIRGDIREVITHFNESQTKQTEHFDEQIAEVRVELDAIKDMLALRKDVEKLERSLLRKGVLTQQDLAAAE